MPMCACVSAYACNSRSLYSSALLLITHSTYAQSDTLVCTVLPAAETSAQRKPVYPFLIPQYTYVSCTTTNTICSAVAYRYASTVAHALCIYSSSVRPLVLSQIVSTIPVHSSSSSAVFDSCMCVCIGQSSLRPAVAACT
jgi:hypothetical protein